MSVAWSLSDRFSYEPFLHTLIWAREDVRWIWESYVKPTRSRGLHNFREISQSPECLNTGKKYHIYYKHISPITLQKKVNFVYLSLDWYLFSQYMLLTIVFPNSQSNRASNKHINRSKFALWKVKLKFVASANTVWMELFQLWILVNLIENTKSVWNIRLLKERNSRWRFWLSWKWVSL